MRLTQFTTVHDKAFYAVNTCTDELVVSRNIHDTSEMLDNLSALISLCLARIKRGGV